MCSNNLLIIILLSRQLHSYAYYVANYPKTRIIIYVIEWNLLIDYCGEYNLYEQV